MPEILPFQPIPKTMPEVWQALFTVDAKRLAKLLCVGLRTIRTWDAMGKLPSPVRIGGRVIWRVDEIRAWLEAGAPHRDEWEARRKASRK